MLVDKAWAVAVREVTASSVFHAYWKRCASLPEDSVCLDLNVRCACRNCAEHLHCSSSKVGVSVELVSEVAHVEGTLYGLAVEISGTVEETFVWLQNPIDHLEPIKARLMHIVTLARRKGFAVFVDVMSQAVLTNIQSTWAIPKQDLNIWHPIGIC